MVQKKSSMIYFYKVTLQVCVCMYIQIYSWELCIFVFGNHILYPFFRKSSVSCKVTSLYFIKYSITQSKINGKSGVILPDLITQVINKAKLVKRLRETTAVTCNICRILVLIPFGNLLQVNGDYSVQTLCLKNGSESPTLIAHKLNPQGIAAPSHEISGVKAIGLSILFFQK